MEFSVQGTAGRNACIALLAVSMLLFIGCGSDGEPVQGEKGIQMGPKIETRIIDYSVDDELIDGDDSYALIRPLWSQGEIYGSLADYEASLSPFSTAQRHLYAINWYMSEVYNGGHDQFFFNSTGIVWPDALQGFRAVGADRAAEILSEAVLRFDSPPSREREERIEQLEAVDRGFDDLDDRLYDLDTDLDQLMLEYARAHRADFYFEGKIEEHVLPEVGD